jgi:hypothetical protein
MESKETCTRHEQMQPGSWVTGGCSGRAICVAPSAAHQIPNQPELGVCSCEFSMEMFRNGPNGCDATFYTHLIEAFMCLFTLAAAGLLLYNLVTFAQARHRRRKQLCTASSSNEIIINGDLEANHQSPRLTSRTPRSSNLSRADVLVVASALTSIAAGFLTLSTGFATSTFFTMDQSLHLQLYRTFIVMEAIFGFFLTCSIACVNVSVFLAISRTLHHWASFEKRLSKRKGVVVMGLMGAVAMAGVVPILARGQVGLTSSIASILLAMMWIAVERLHQRLRKILQKMNLFASSTPQVVDVLKAVDDSIRRIILFLGGLIFGCMMTSCFWYVGWQTQSQILLGPLSAVAFGVIRLSELALLTTIVNTVTNLLCMRDVKRAERPNSGAHRVTVAILTVPVATVNDGICMDGSFKVSPFQAELAGIVDSNDNNDSQRDRQNP